LRLSKDLELKPGCKTILSFQSEKKAASSFQSLATIRFGTDVAP